MGRYGRAGDPAEGRTLLEVLLRRRDHLEGNDLETPLFKARDDGPNKVALDAIGLDHDIGALVVGHVGWCARDSGSGLKREEKRGSSSA